MQNTDPINDFKTFFQEGLAHDIFMSQVHYFIYRTIGENALLVNQMKDSGERKQLNYLQETSMHMTLVSLSRIFDTQNRNKKYKARCLATLIEECDRIPGSFPLNLDYYPDLKKLSSLTNINVPAGFDGKDQLIFFYSTVLNSDSVQNAVKNLKTVRDKFVVHNEHNPNIEQLSTFWDDCSFLQDIAKLCLSTVGKIFLGTSYAPLQKIDTNKFNFNIVYQSGWIVDLLEKVLGEDNVKIWWE